MTDEEYVDVDSELGFEPAVSDRAVSGKSSHGPQTPRKNRGGLRRRVASFAVLVGALTTVGGGYALLAPSSGADDTASSSADVAKGRQLFETSCITCHGANLQGVTGRGPTIVGVGSAAVYFQVSTGRMPAPSQGAVNLRKDPQFNEAETLQLGAYVQSIGGGPQVPAAGTDLRASGAAIANGGELFRLNCASCHGATAHGAPLSAGKIAPALNESTDAQIYTAMITGPENMPVFSNNQITPEQKREIIGYVEYLRASKDPGGSGIGRLGPVSEGIVIWTVGIGALMVTILWIGAKS